MGLTVVAQWLNDTFYAFDEAIFRAFHDLALSAGGVLTPLTQAVSWTGWKGAFLILVALVLIFFKKTRRTGICALLAIAIGGLFTNILVKNLVARPRPYTWPEFQEWWNYVGAATESDFCFPSGHMTVATDFMTAVLLTRGGKWAPVAVVYILLMAFSRVYLIVHYTTDVIGGFVFGLVAGILSFLIVRAVYKRFGGTRLLRDT